MTSSNGNIFRVTGHLCGEFTGPGEFPAQRPVTRSFDVFLDLRPNKRLSEQWWGWWFETQSCPLWRHSYASPSDAVMCITCFLIYIWIWNVTTWMNVSFCLFNRSHSLSHYIQPSRSDAVSLRKDMNISALWIKQTRAKHVGIGSRHRYIKPLKSSWGISSSALYLISYQRRMLLTS